MAWLNATPKPDERSKRAKLQADTPQLSRMDSLKRDGVTLMMPPNPAPHIVDRLIEMGMSEAAGMGVAPLSWREIDAWCARTAVDLDPWEGRLLRRLSAEYIAEGRRAEREACPPPWRGPVTESEVKAERLALDLLLD